YARAFQNHRRKPNGSHRAWIFDGCAATARGRRAAGFSSSRAEASPTGGTTGSESRVERGEKNHGTPRQGYDRGGRSNARGQVRLSADARADDVWPSGNTHGRR